MIHAKNNFQTLSGNGMASTRGCSAVCFENKGNVTFYINNYKVPPFDGSLSLNQEAGTLDMTEYHIRFDFTDKETTGTDAQCGIITTYLTLNIV